MTPTPTKLVLDTSVVRGLGAGEVAAAPFVRLKGAGIRIHLADTTILELARALLSRSMPWEHWDLARSELKELLCRHEPILLSPRGSDATVVHSHERELATMNGIWRILCRASSHDALLTIAVDNLERGTMVLDLREIERAIRAQKEAWNRLLGIFGREARKVAAEVIAKLPRKGDERGHLDVLAREVGVFADSQEPGAEVKPSLRFDAYVRFNLLFALRRLKPFEPYNPRKKSNDAVDWEMLKHLARPAAVCTRDDRLLAALKSAGTWQFKWVFRPEDLETAQARETILALDWPATG